MSNWGGYYEILSKDCKEENLTNLDPIFQLVLDLEKTENLYDLFDILDNIDEKTQNKLNSPLLDGLILFKKQRKFLNLDTVKFLVKRDKIKIGTHLEAAVKSTLEVLQFFLETYKPEKKGLETVCFSQAANMPLENIKYLLEQNLIPLTLKHGFQYKCSLLAQVCFGGNIETVTWLLEKTKELVTEEENPLHMYENSALHNAISCGDIKLVKFLLDKGAYFEDYMYNTLSFLIKEDMKKTDLEIVDLFINENSSIDELHDIMKIAIGNGDYFTVKFMANKCLELGI